MEILLLASKCEKTHKVTKKCFHVICPVEENSPLIHNRGKKDADKPEKHAISLPTYTRRLMQTIIFKLAIVCNPKHVDIVYNFCLAESPHCRCWTVVETIDHFTTSYQTYQATQKVQRPKPLANSGYQHFQNTLSQSM